MTNDANRRILLIDDNQDIHRDFRKILAGGEGEAEAAESLKGVEDALFGDDDEDAGAPGASPSEVAGVERAADFELASALQGQEGCEMAAAARREGRPFAMAFVDMRMPPGWDGVETIQHLWEDDPDLQIVVCTAFADYTWTEMIGKLGRTDQLLILKKPFDAIEVCQLATAMTEKWSLVRRERQRMEEVVRAEGEARAYAASLETVNRALEQAKLTAEAEARARSEFLARMTGGILDPMTGLVDEAARIRGFEPTDEEWMTLVEGLCRDGQQLSSSLQDVLDLSELETGKLQLERAACSPRDMAEAVVESLREEGEAKGLELRVECAEGAPESIVSDAGRIRRVLHHLVWNAVKYTEQGGVRVEVSGAPDAGGHVRFAVVDSGPGLSPDQRAHLFDAFCHADAAERDPRDGAGLGLHLSRRLAGALGGDLRIVEGGPGTRVELSIQGAPQPAGG